MQCFFHIWLCLSNRQNVKTLYSSRFINFLLFFSICDRKYVQKDCFQSQGKFFLHFLDLTSICSWAMFWQQRYYHSLSAGCSLLTQKCNSCFENNELDINKKSRSSAFSHNNQTDECSLHQVISPKIKIKNFKMGK